MFSHFESEPFECLFLSKFFCDQIQAMYKCYLQISRTICRSSSMKEKKKPAFTAWSKSTCIKGRVQKDMVIFERGY